MPEPILRITSLKNDQVKGLVRLRNRRERDQTALTIIEEPLVLRRALAAEYPLQKLYYCPEQIDPQDRELQARLQACCPEPAVELTPPVMDKVSYREKSEGLLVVAPQVAHRLQDLELGADTSSDALVLVLEAVEKPGNLGAALRIADGAGAHAVIICGAGTDLFNPNVLRASRGAFFNVPTVFADREQVVEFLRGQGLQLVAASPQAHSPWDQCDLTVPVALVLGTEHQGLSPELAGQCDQRISLPMLGSGDSLNVSTTAAILLYEALRQRRNPPTEGPA